MKQVLRDLKIHAFINLLPKIIVLGGMGGAGLFAGKEYPIFYVMAAGMLLLALWLAAGTLSGLQLKKVKELTAKMDAAEQEKLALDYRNAWQGSRNIKIGKDFTFVYDDAGRIYRNSEIIWIYEWHENQNLYFNLHLINKQEPEILGADQKTYKNILEYYEKRFPHIVVGRSDEAGYLYRNDRERFLQLKYYNGQE